MRLRSIILGLGCCLLASAGQAAEKPYRVSLVGDGFDGRAWQTGVLIELDPGWKTYWRMPGEAGIPPEFTWKTSEPARVEVLFPAPGRHQDPSGETVGYEGQVVFPVSVTPEMASSLDLGLELFFAVCKDICIPASASAAITLGPQQRDPAGAARVEEARSAVPAAGAAVTGARIIMEGARPVLQLDLSERPDDIFVETASTAYFRAPQFAADGRQALLAIDNLPDPAKLAGTALTLTYRVGGRALQQDVTLP